MTLQTDLEAAVAAAKNDSQKLKEIVNGPESGPDSLVEVDSGTVKTLSRALAEVGDTSNQALKDLSNVDDADFAAKAGAAVAPADIGAAAEVHTHGLADIDDAGSAAAADTGTDDADVPTNADLKETARQFTGQQGIAAVPLTDAPTITWDADSQQVATVTITDNRVLGAITGPHEGNTYVLAVVQDATGGRDLDCSNAIYDWGVDGEPDWAAQAANAVTIVTAIHIGGKMRMAAREGYGA